MKTQSLKLALASVLLLFCTGPVWAEEISTTTNEVQIVTSKNNYAEMDKVNQAIIQLCLKEECASQKALLTQLLPSYPGLTFVQMPTADNVEFAERIKMEEQAGAEAEHNWFMRLVRAILRWLGCGGELAHVQYPLYIFKGNDLNVAHNVSTAHELKRFIELNASYAKDEHEGS